MYLAIKNTGKNDSYINATFLQKADLTGHRTHLSLSDFMPGKVVVIEKDFAEHLLRTMREDVELVNDEAWADAVVKEGIVRPYTPYVDFSDEAKTYEVPVEKNQQAPADEAKRGPGRPPKAVEE
jgi:hypothetical protein